jgi:F-type H+-transporting ATPase subunit b
VVNINLTLIVQMLVFAVLIWFTMKFVWPMILGAMDERARKIAQGLAAAAEGEKDLSQAREKADVIIREARERASQIIDQAQHRANDLVEQAKGTATSEGARLVAAAQQQIQLDTSRARESLRKEVAQIAVRAASKLLEREIDPRSHADLIDKLAAQI